MPGFKTNIFLTDQDLDNISRWKYKISDYSISTKFLTPVWERLATMIPRSIAPNILTFAGLVCALQAFWLVCKHGMDFPVTSAVAATLLTYAHYTLTAVDGKHALTTKNQSVLGEVFDLSSIFIGAPFQVITLLKIMGGQAQDARGWNHPATQWYLVQAVQLFFLSQHVTPYNAPDKTIRFGLLSGPGEIIHVIVATMSLHAIVGQAFLWDLLKVILTAINDKVDCIHLPITEQGDIDAMQVVESGAVCAYALVLVIVVLQLVNMLRHKDEHNRTSGGLLILCLLLRAVPAFIIWGTEGASDLMQTVSDGAFLSILTSDIVIAKMAKRPVNSLLLVMTMASIMSNFAIYGCLVLYYFSVFGDICKHMNLPLFSVVTNVFCDGVFDLLHRGHMEQFRKAHQVVSGGTRLFVGVCNDAETTAYKRLPIMRDEERYASVSSCKYVHAVIPNSPISHEISKPGEPLTRSEKIIKDHNIHVFAIGREYNNVAPGKRDYYKLPRSLDMLRYTERTGGVSTSLLIKRIADRAHEFVTPPKAPSESAAGGADKNKNSPAQAPDNNKNTKKRKATTIRRSKRQKQNKDQS